MSKQALNNLFAPTKKITRPVTVVRQLSTTSYLVEDSVGRQLQAFCADTDWYPPGAEVILQNDQIVRSGRRLGKADRKEV